MKHIFRLTMTLALTLAIAATGFAVVNPSTNLKPADTIEKQTKMKKYSKYRRQSGKKIGNKGRTSVRRVYRLTKRQRNYYNQRLLNIFIN
jgi:uncharacterized protein YaiI (UPF0178 family)